MHWFWRAAIAVGVGLAWTVSVEVVGHVTHFNRGPSLVMVPVFDEMTRYLAAAIGSPVIVLLVYAQLTRCYYRDREDYSVTRCRKCNYILRGITEPRCPECGEAI